MGDGVARGGLDLSESETMSTVSQQEEGGQQAVAKAARSLRGGS